MPTIKELHFYPIKSFRGLRVHELSLDKMGPRFDRQWMLVDENNRFLTQRQLPLLARIGLRMEEDFGVELSAGDLGTVDFGLEEREGDEFNVTVWKDQVPAFEVSGEVSAWLSEFTGQKVRLVRLSENAKRAFRPDFPERSIRFVDQQPLLVVSTASLKGLEAKAGVTLAVTRFRPNIVVEGASEHEEDTWPGFQAGSLKFRALKPCTRCKITTVHPLTGAMGEEPLKTLMTYRRGEKGVMFGYYYAHLNEGRLKVGEKLAIGPV